MSAGPLARRRLVRIGGVVVPVRPRSLLWLLACALGIAAALCASIGIGEVPIPLGDVAAALVGGGTTGDRFIVVGLRAPRALVALGVGLALGIGGALVQTVTRNALASPDVIGILSGASAGAVATIVLGTSTGAGIISTLGPTAAAIVGGMLAAAAVLVLSWGREASDLRLVLVGIGVAATCSALTSLLLVGARVHEAAQAVVWLTGTLDGRTWTHVWPLLGALAIVLPLLVPLGHRLDALALGDVLARSVGVAAGPVRLAAIGCATVLAAAAVAAAGPIAFVAFAAPQIMLRVVGSATPPLLASGLGGALLLLITDVATRILLPVGLPVGIVTVAIGAPCFLVLLLARRRRLTA